jgi:[acyl-carrier-protein] S-malonyltransferase
VWVANDNAPGQVVISGTRAGIDDAVRELSAAGARRIVPLAVSGAFHSPLMQQAADSFAQVLRDVPFRDAAYPVVQNAVPEPTRDAAAIRERLAAQIACPVRWTETMLALRDLGAEVFVEAGPGAVLTGLARRIDGVHALAAETEGVARAVEEVFS